MTASDDGHDSAVKREYTDDELLFALDRLAMGFESADPHIRHEAKMVAKQNLGGIVAALEAADAC